MSARVAPAPIPALQLTGRAGNAVLTTAVWQLLIESGANQAPHSGRTLQDHLLGTWHLLKSWGSSDSVCLAGLFHSIYGTNVFIRKCLLAADRPKLRSAIGTDAEALTWLFCNIDRPSAILQGLEQLPRLDKSPDAQLKDTCIELRQRRGHDKATLPNPTPLQATAEQLCALAQIECANLIEQGGWSVSLRDFYCAAIEYPVLNKSATAALQGVWTRHAAQRTAMAEPASSVPLTQHMTSESNR